MLFQSTSMTFLAIRDAFCSCHVFPLKSLFSSCPCLFLYLISSFDRQTNLVRCHNNFRLGNRRNSQVPIRIEIDLCSFHFQCSTTNVNTHQPNARSVFDCDIVKCEIDRKTDLVILSLVKIHQRTDAMRYSKKKKNCTSFRQTKVDFESDIVRQTILISPKIYFQMIFVFSFSFVSMSIDVEMLLILWHFFCFRCRAGTYFLDVDNAIDSICNSAFDDIIRARVCIECDRTTKKNL